MSTPSGAHSRPQASPATTSPAAGTPTATRLPAKQADAVQHLLSAVQAAVYAYGVVGAQAPPTRRSAALARLQEHAARRDLLAGRLSAGGRTPAPAAPAYALPFPVTTPRAALALAAHVESGVADACADLVAGVAGSARVEASRWLAEAGKAARLWGAAPTAFPGLPERQPSTTS